MTKRVGLIGYPVEHSRSPALHHAAFASMGVDAQYELWSTPPEQLAERVASLREPQMLGANVTLPHKIAVAGLVDRLESAAQAVGAVNTIIREQDGSLTGTNTDVQGFYDSLIEDAHFDPRGQTAVILGASGAARAAVVALLKGGATSLVVVNRTLERAEALLADMLIDLDDDPILMACEPDDPELPLLISEASLIVNATSLGWHTDETPLDATHIKPGMLVYDMVYRRTRLLHEAESRGASSCDGMHMLIRQAALASARWTGNPPPLAAMRAVIQ